MIVRIFSEGQYELPEAALAGLGELDEQTQAAVDAGDERRFHDLYRRLLDHIRQAGTPLASDDLRPSDLIALSPDTTLAEAAREFRGHGLLPD
ncbi:MAG: PspA-associated protein PspAA [Solirubrobacteraceae bacterium]